MDDVVIYPDPNPALTDVLTGSAMRSLMSERAQLARDLYQAVVAKRSGALAASAQAYTELERPLKGEVRWVGVMSVGGAGVDYALAHEFGMGDHPNSVKNLDRAQFVQQAHHDLNHVLDALGGL